MRGRGYLPAARPVVGLLGGSFNPPHAGHLAISRAVMRKLRLKAIWWLVSPQNPLKVEKASDVTMRLAACRQMLRHQPAITAHALESLLGTRYTVDTLRQLRKRYPKTRFIWVMGADNLAQFHRWKQWRDIAQLVPILVVDRAPHSHAALHSKAAIALKRWRVGHHVAGKTPRWGMAYVARRKESSTNERMKHWSG